MADNPYLDEFEKNYERPQVDGLIVGFSGIDPQRKSSGSGGSCNCDNSTLSPEQKEIVKQLIHDAISLIDFSDCDCDPTKLSDEQKKIIRNIINERLEELDINYDGGEINPVNPEPAPSPEPEPVNESDLDHEKLKGLLGGNEDGHYHLSRYELTKLAGYPLFSDIKHERLPDLLGGDSNGHFHLTTDEIKKLRTMIGTFFPDGSNEVIIKPPAPVVPVNPLDPYDPYGGIPSGNPPAWQINLLPSGYEAHENIKKMYCGEFPHATYNNGLFVKLKKSGGSISDSRMMFSNDLNNWQAWEKYSDNNINNPVNSWIHKITQFLPTHSNIIENNLSDEFFILTSNANEDYRYTKIPYFYKTSSGGYSIKTFQLVSSSIARYVAACYSELLQCIIFVSKGKKDNLQYPFIIAKKTKGIANISQTFGYTNIVTVNDGCAAWHPTTAVFCLTGLEGTSTSFDGEIWTLNSDAPHDLRELSYRQDLDAFVAWSGEDKTFYASVDGIEWTQLSDTPIPLENISTVNYEPSNGWYCAVGIDDGNAYFSKDLKHWIPTKLRNNSKVDIADVIFMPSTGLYVAMPTSGIYYYTFNPSDWTD